MHRLKINIPKAANHFDFPQVWPMGYLWANLSTALNIWPRRRGGLDTMNSDVVPLPVTSKGFSQYLGYGNYPDNNERCAMQCAGDLSESFETHRKLLWTDGLNRLLFIVALKGIMSKAGFNRQGAKYMLADGTVHQKIHFSSIAVTVDRFQWTGAVLLHLVCIATVKTL